MTISTTANNQKWTGNGTTTVFDITFVFFDPSLLQVFLIDTSGNVTRKTYTTDYSVTGGSDAVGTLTMNVAPPSGYTLLVVRNEAYTQSDHFINNDPNDAVVMETALDRLTVLAQQAAFGNT